MKLPQRRSVLWFIGLLLAGSIALGYDYIFFYDPPIRTVQKFEKAMGWGDVEAVKPLIAISSSMDLEDLREPTDEEVKQLVAEPFHVGRILEVRQRDDDKRKYHYVVYRNTDAQVYAIIVTEMAGKPRVVISDRRTAAPSRYLWEYAWTY
jgi:hypothetical protein